MSASPRPPTTTTDQIRAVERELALRRRVFPRRVDAGTMSQEVADHELAVFEDLLARLRSTDQAEAEATWPTLFAL